MKKHYNIAYMSAHKSSGYPVGLQNGVKNALDEQNQNLIMLADLLPFNFIDTADQYFHLAFEMAARLNFDAYIVPVGILNQYTRISKEWDGARLAGLLPTDKTLVIEDVLDGYRYITKDNQSGMHELMRYLIEERSLRKICFLSGPEKSFGARERERVYFDEMQTHQLPVTDEMFARGIYSGACDEVVEEMLLRNPDVEAIACANDHMAMSVYRVLKGHGLTPGVDVAVTGFDDDPLALSAMPPLATVRLSAYDIGYAAGYEAVRLCEKLPQEITVCKSAFVKRASCGETIHAADNPYEHLFADGTCDVDALTEQLLSDTLETASGTVREECMERMQRIARKLLAVLDENAPIEEGTLIDAKDLVDVFRYDSISYLSYEKFQTAILSCLDVIEPMLAEGRGHWLLGQKVQFQHLISNNIRTQYENREWEKDERQWAVTQIVSDALMYSDDKHKALRAMLKALKELGLLTVYLFEFPEEMEFFHKTNLALSDKLYLCGELKDGNIRVYDEHRMYDLHRLAKRFLPETLTEGERLMTSGQYTVGCLLSGMEMGGLMIIGPSMLHSSEIVRIYYQMAFGMKHLQMFGEQKELLTALNRNNIKLSRESEHDELTGLHNRRGFMHSLERRLNDGTGRQSDDGWEQRAALYFMDLDGLKGINDTYGHEEGDFAIVQTARILQKAFDGALIGRLGGDEYLGFRFLRASDETDGEWMLSHIETLMEEFNAASDKPYRLEISVGYQAFSVDGETWTRVPQIIEEADTMLYENKRARKARKR